MVALSRALSTTPHAAALTLPQPPLSRADALLLLLLLLLLLQLVLLLLSLRLPLAPAAPALLQLPSGQDAFERQRSAVRSSAPPAPARPALALTRILLGTGSDL